MAKEYTKQHIVPQSYLDNFGTKEKKPKLAVRRVFYTNKIDFQIQATKEVGYIKNYYSIESDEDYAFYEKLISRSIEYPMNDLLKRIITNSTMMQEGAEILNDEIVKDLAKYISFQSLRVPAFYGEQLRKGSSIIRKTKQEMLKALYFYPEYIKRNIKSINFRKDDYKRILLDRITSEEVLSLLAKHLAESHKWFAYINKEADIMPFITSDNPVVISNIISGKIGIENGLANNDTAIIFPVSPRVMIQAIPKKVFNNNQLRNTIVLDQKETKFIVECNILQERQRYRETYYPVWFYQDIVINKEVA